MLVVENINKENLIKVIVKNIQYLQQLLYCQLETFSTQYSKASLFALKG